MRLLIVEDEEKIANALKRGLEQERFAVDVCYNGDDGLASIMGDEYDAVILDRMLPGAYDGMKICEQVRAKDINTPILMLTAKDKVEDRVDGLNIGADDYLVKPFAFDELLARIRALLRRPQSNDGVVLQVDDLKLDTVSYTVTRNKQDISLSSKEFALLEYLMRNTDRVLSKANLTSHVWDFDADILPNTVEVYIGYLRAKVDRPFRTRPALIHTVRGFGYKLGVTAK